MGEHLHSGHTQSCGCLQRALFARAPAVPEDLRREVRDGFSEIRARLAVLERPRVARVVVDPARPAGVNGGS
jgi:hypothetical protein